VITGFAAQPFAEHWHPTYAEQRARRAPIYPGRCRPEPPAHGEIADGYEVRR
jgi:hypothetical protein